MQVDGKGLIFDVVGRLKGQPAEVTDIVLEVLHSAVERHIITSRQLEDVVTEVVQGKERGYPGGKLRLPCIASSQGSFPQCQRQRQRWCNTRLPHLHRICFGIHDAALACLVQALKEPPPLWAVCA